MTDWSWKILSVAAFFSQGNSSALIRWQMSFKLKQKQYMYNPLFKITVQTLVDLTYYVTCYFHKVGLNSSKGLCMRGGLLCFHKCFHFWYSRIPFILHAAILRSSWSYSILFTKAFGVRLDSPFPHVISELATPAFIWLIVHTLMSF